MAAFALAGALFPILVFAGQGAVGEPALEASGKLRMLTTAREAHDLTSEDAALGYPVHLRGVVTCIDPSTGPGHAAMFVHDATGTVYVMLSDALGMAFPAGTMVDVRGVTDPGSFAPIVEHTHITVLGHTHLPGNPPQEDLAHLATGTADGKWVEVEGIVHSVVEHQPSALGSHSYVTLQLAMTDGSVGVSMLRDEGFDYARLVDAKVRIEANAAPMFNRNDQLMGARLMAPGLSALQILEAAPNDAFEQPITTIDQLLRWDKLVTERHRVHIRGRVTMLWPGSSFCLQDTTRGICAQTVQETNLALGEIADVVGFAGAENGTPVLTDAVYRSAGSSAPVAAKPITAEQALLGRVIIQQKSRTDYESEVIQVDGKLIGSDLTSTDVTLLLSSGDIIFPAILPKNLAGSGAKAWEIGSRVRVTGICSVRLDTTSGVAGSGVAAAKSFRILMRSPSDVVVLEHPSWWTPSHALVVLALALTGTLIVLVWVVILRRRVERQSVLLKESEERFRHMAQHDSLTGLATRLVLQDRLEVALERVKRNHSGLALLMLDLDKFKEINDTFGHHAGDEVLRVTSTRVAECVRKSDTVARMGGDEFVILLPDLSDPRIAETIAAKIVAALSVPIPFAGRALSLTVSVGICFASAEEMDPDALLKNVDAALYRAKAQGRNRFQAFTPQTAPA